MIEYLNEDEVFRVGMCMEEAGLAFYTEMAEKADDAHTRRIFKRLAKDEKEHLALFESLDAKTKGGLGSRPAGQDQEISAYVCSLVDGGIFKNIDKMAQLGGRKFSPESALELALAVEKDAVLYYTEAHRANPRGASKKALARLIDEEKGHVTMIVKRLQSLKTRKKTAAKSAKGKTRKK